MDIKGWRYYNHAAVPTTSPDVKANLAPIHDGSIWKIGGGYALLARWTTNWDCKYETNWWYVIKDTPFDISSLKAKRRYEINKGKRNFTVKRINPSDYREELYLVTLEALQGWPEKYRPHVEKNEFYTHLNSLTSTIVYAAFSQKDEKMAGYAYLTVMGKNLDFNVLRTRPDCERDGVNAAIVAFILEDNSGIIDNGNFICDGSRSIRHETGFQDYLEKYFGFRKAYCDLQIRYRKPIKAIVDILYQLRRPLKKLDNIGFIHSINALLEMEKIVRN